MSILSASGTRGLPPETDRLVTDFFFDMAKKFLAGKVSLKRRSGVYPYCVAKAEKKGRTKEEVDEIIFWLTGYDAQGLQRILGDKTDFRNFFDNAPQLNPNVSKITGVICGYRVEEIEDDIMQKVRYLDKLVDELAKGKAIEKV